MLELVVMQLNGSVEVLVLHCARGEEESGARERAMHVVNAPVEVGRYLFVDCWGL